MNNKINSPLNAEIVQIHGSQNESNIVKINIDDATYCIVLPNASTDYIQKKIAHECKPYEAEMLADMRRRTDDNSLILDVGANIGNHTLYLAATTNCHVIAFEPNLNLCGSLLTSIELNDMTERVQVRAIAIGEKSETGHFAEQIPSNLGAQRIEIGNGPIKIAALDSFHFHRPICIVKIDVEGMELEVLKGAEQILLNSRPTLYVECLTENDFKEVSSWLDKLGYSYWDTFNATPTHLFLPNEGIRIEQRLTRLQNKVAQADYRTGHQLVKIREKLDDANLKYRTAMEQAAALKQKAADQETARSLAASRVTELQIQLESTTQNLEREQTQHQEQVRELRSEVKTQNEAFHAKQIELIRSESVLETLRAQLESANQKYRSVTEQAAALKQKAADQETARSLAASRVTELQIQLESTTQNLEREQTQHQEQVRELRSEVKTQNEAFHAAQIELVRSESVLETLRAQLDSANQKYRIVTEQAASLKETLKELESEHQTLAEEVSQLKNQLADAITMLQKQKFERLAQIETLETRLVDANLKYRSSTEQYAAYKAEATSRSDLTTAENKELTFQTEKLNLSLLEATQRLSESQRDLERLNLGKLASENQVAKTRAMLSFQLGYTLLHGFKSLRAFSKLPSQLIALRRESIRRRKISVEKNHFSVIKTLPTSSNKLPRLDSKTFSTPTLISPDFKKSDPAKALKAMRVAGIMDELTHSSYQSECNLLQLSVGNWQDELTKFKPELLFIESAWRGKNEKWGSKVGHTSTEVISIIEWCRIQSIPTVFWNKEDPVHFETFLRTAKLFDYVFTTDIDCIQRYKKALEHDRVYLLPFACQPGIHNPIEKYQRKDAFCFAGSYYVRYPERTRDLSNFISSLVEYRPIEIYDRNYGKNDPNYQFPPEYQPFIVGNLPFNQIDKAYKGYRYAINLNSIKQSQSMFARRIFELLASNTVTVSNFSRGVRVLFGDLVITSDNGNEIIRRLQSLGDDDATLRKFRLTGLRKVMASHTYQDRLAYVVSKVQGQAIPTLLPQVMVTAYAKNQAQFDALIASYQRQSYSNSHCLIVVPGGFQPQNNSNSENVKILSANAAAEMRLGELDDEASLIAGLVPDDYYGPNYLLDLALATRYSSATAIGKVSHHVWSANGELGLANPGCQYVAAKVVSARSAVVQLSFAADITIRDWVISLYTRQIEASELLSIDEFNYCKNGSATNFSSVQVEAVNDLPGMDEGLETQELITRAELIAPEETEADVAVMLSGEKLAGYFSQTSGKNYTLGLAETEWNVESILADGKHEYLYAASDLRPGELGYESNAQFYLDASTGLNLQMVMLFLDANKQRISHIVKTANQNQEVAIPAGTEWIRLGLRIYGSGAASIHGLVLGHRPLKPAQVLGRADHLLLTNHYPSYDDLYRNGFVHTRVAAYAERGVKVDIFRLRNDQALSFHEFQNSDAITGSQEALHQLLTSGKYKSILVHFLDEAMWEVLKYHIDRIKVIVWVHGAEIQPWHRRDYNNENEEQRQVAKEKSEVRMRFWRGLLREMPAKLRLVFVSKYFAEEVMEDLGFRLPSDAYQVIHNPINTDLFAYHPKPPEQRMKILSIRPYASRKYANDLSVKAIMALSKQPWFDELEIRMIGDGTLFDEVLAPLRQFKNVVIERRFLSQSEIAQLHREYGIFLCPTRMDAQGVSRDEAMSSGLVPVTNAVTAIPEFTDKSCALLAEEDDFSEMAKLLTEIIEDPTMFQMMSIKAANRVRDQSSYVKILPIEINLIKND